MAPPTLKRPHSTDKSVSPPPPSKRPAVAATTTSTSKTTSKAVANFFTPVSQKSPEKTAFRIVQESLLVGTYTDPAFKIVQSKPVKFAAFDFDGTLIATKSGLAFARNQDDWKWWHASVPGRLRELHAQGYGLVVISNQGGVKLRSEGGKSSVKSDLQRFNIFKSKVAVVFNALELPIRIYAATGKDRFRKPRTGMWEEILKDHGITGAEGEIDHENCLFVGDAAGRVEDKAAKVKKDHSCSDRDFAANVDIPFHTPEEFFLGEAVKPFTRTFDPATYVEVELDSKTDQTPIMFTKKQDVELVLFCGSPGAGKSTFYWRRLQPLGYERVNQDTLKSRDRCMKAATGFIEEGKSVVVDNTNADIETRAAWVALAKQLRVPVRLVHFTASAKLCQHNDTVRALAGEFMNPEGRTMLPTLAFTGFASRYREPHTNEGFEDITKVDFTFSGTEEARAIWRRYWVS